MKETEKERKRENVGKIQEGRDWENWEKSPVKEKRKKRREQSKFHISLHL